ncbi:MAG: M20/M25/M40 family metallo-hydrolase [Reichenbachiella sp.]|uniref:M20/M25/M40 family metallo-hydrolase n=1 Tax=Reichenbachiella sp. TaxID=2184521 RepID=UPI003266F8AC
MKSILVALLLSGLALMCSAQISKIESKIVRSVEIHNQTYVQLLKDVVNTNSGTMNFDGVRAVGMTLKPYFDDLGMETTWVSGESFNRAGHLVAVNKGTKGPKLLLIGHLDTVFEPDHPFQSFQMLNDSLIQGPGVIDMKGGDVIILAALHALKDAGVLKDMHIEVVLTGDEEKSGSPLELSKKAIIEASERADIALAFENADGDPRTIVVTRRGSSGWKLEVTGNAAHSSQIFTERVGVGSIYETSRILNAFYTELSTEENLTFNPGVILGGTAITYDNNKNGGTAYGKSNVVAKQTLVNGDIRAVSLEQLSRAKEAMLRITAENRPGTSSELTFKAGGYPPLTETEGNHVLLGYYSKVSQDLGYGEVKPVHPRKAGAADVSFTNGLVDMAIDGLGLAGSDDHTANETGNLNYLPIQSKRAAVLMYRLCFDTN